MALVLKKENFTILNGKSYGWGALCFTNTSFSFGILIIECWSWLLWLLLLYHFVHGSNFHVKSWC